MKRGIIILLIIAGPFRGTWAQINNGSTIFHITFLLYSPDLPDNSRVYITGNIPDLGNWDPSKVPMNFEGNHRWSKKIIVYDTLSIEYKFTKGSWDREAVDDNGNPYQNFVLNAITDTTMEINILFWKNGMSKKIVHGRITGTVKYIRQLPGKGLLSRDIIIWLPPGYEKNKKERYPVLYMQDGQNIIDPATSAFGYDWQVDETCDSLIKNRIIEPLIVVGIYNTPDRSLEYTPGDTGDAYMRFVVTRLKPLIDSSYRTLRDRDHTYVGGSSAGGLVAFMLAWEYPDIFSDAICFSPAFRIMSIDYVSVAKDTDYPPMHSFFYIYNGGIGLESQLQPGVTAMISALKNKGYREGRDYMYVIDPSARHTEQDWAKHFAGAIIASLSEK